MRTFFVQMFTIVVTCYSLQNLKDIECKTYCKSSQGYDSGVYTNEQCWCANKISQERLDEKKLIVPSKRKPSKVSSIVPYNFPFDEITKLPWED